MPVNASAKAPEVTPRALIWPGIVPGRVRTASWGLAGFTLLILVAALVLLVLLGLNAKPMGASKIAFDAALGLAVVVYAAVGRLIASRVPGNAIGWLLGLIGLSLAAAVLTEQYALYGLAGGLTNALAGGKVTYPNPLGIFPSHGWFSVTLAVIFVFSVITAAFVLASVFVRRRGASPELRKQLAWLGYVGLMTVLWAVVLGVTTLATDGSSGLVGALSWILLALTPLVGIPAACAVAVLKYRLYEIDRVISRTLAYAIVTGLLVGVYAGLVLLASACCR